MIGWLLLVMFLIIVIWFFVQIGINRLQQKVNKIQHEANKNLGEWMGKQQDINDVVYGRLGKLEKKR